MFGKGEINIGGKLRSFKFGVNATSLFCKKRGITLKGFTELFNAGTMKSLDFAPEVVRDLFWACLADGARISKSEIDFDEFAVGDWMDEMAAGEKEKAFSIVSDGQPQAGENDEKKNTQENPTT